MRILIRLASSLATLGLIAAAAAQTPAPQPVAETEARTPEAEAAGFHLPPGFAIELVASEPLIGKPMNLAFDARGRLWVTSTVEYPFPAAEGTTPRDRVLILSDFGPDGRARRVETFAAGLNIPIGVLPLGKGDAALVHSIPSIHRHTDTDGDGKADRVEVAYHEFGSKDTHGMTNAFTRGFDGWIYACHGFSNTSTVSGKDGQAITMQSGNIYRFQPDGTRAELFSHGQVNPFGLTFDPMGRLYSCDCHSRPVYQNLRGAHYPSFGRADDGLGYGPEMIKHDHGSTGIGGVAYYDADHFPPEYRDSIYLGNVVTGRVHRDTLDWAGSSPRASTQPDMVSSDDPWFRPVDIELGPDGALYVADFYNRIIGHYEVPLDHPGRDRERGRIWRIVYRGISGQNPPPTDPRPNAVAAPAADLIADLGHPNMAVRSRAADLLVLQGKEAVGAAVTSALDSSRGWRTVHALWVSHRLGTLDDARLLAATRHDDEAVRVHAARIWADRGLGLDGFASVAASLRDPSPHVRRAAAEALGVRPSFAAIRPLLDLLAATPAADDHLRHAARLSLREPLRDDSSWDKLALSPQDEATVAEVAVGIPSAGSARFLLGYLTRHPDRIDRFDRMVRHVARHGDGDPQSPLVALIRANHSSLVDQAKLLKAIAGAIQERKGTLGPDLLVLADEVAHSLLDASDPRIAGAGIDLAGSLPLVKLADRLASLTLDRSVPVPTRLAAAPVWARLDPGGAVAGLAGCLGDAAEPVEIRDGAAKALAASGRPAARTALVDAMRLAPARVQTTIASNLAATRPGAEALLDAVAAGKASPRPLGERSVVTKLEASGLPAVKARLAALLKDIPPADQRVLALIDARRADFAKATGGDASLGAAVFTKNCATCHQIEGQGARVGPQLDGIGVRGLDRLLEDVLDPNRNIDQAFRTTNLALIDGRVVSGLLLRQDGDVLILADAEGKEVRIPEGTVENREVAQLSPMPANWGDTIDPADFRHLMAYLLTRRPAGLDGASK